MGVGYQSKAWQRYGKRQGAQDSDSICMCQIEMHVSQFQNNHIATGLLQYSPMCTLVGPAGGALPGNSPHPQYSYGSSPIRSSQLPVRWVPHVVQGVLWNCVDCASCRDACHAHDGRQAKALHDKHLECPPSCSAQLHFTSHLAVTK